MAETKRCIFIVKKGKNKATCSSGYGRCEAYDSCKDFCRRHCPCDGGEKLEKVCGFISGDRCASGRARKDCCGKCERHCKCLSEKTPAKSRANREETNAKIAANAAPTPAQVKYGVPEEIVNSNVALFDALGVDVVRLNRILPDRLRYAANPLESIARITTSKDEIGEFFLHVVELTAGKILPNDNSGFLVKVLYEALAKTRASVNISTLTPLQSFLSALQIDKSKIDKNLPSRSTCEAVNAISTIENMRNSDRATQALTKLLLLCTESIAKLIIPQDKTGWLMTKFLSTERMKVLESLATGLFQSIHSMAQHPHTITYRTARAIVSARASKIKLKKHLNDLKPPNIGTRARRKGRVDFKRIMDHKEPEKVKRSLARVPNVSIERAVAHTMANVQTLSWGTKTVRKEGSNDSVVLPKLTRKHTIDSMFKDFVKKETQQKALRPNDKDFDVILGRSSYFQICSMLTSGREKSKKCIDYVVDCLVNTKMATLDTIIQDLVAPTRKKEMLHHLELVQNFLKYQFDDHVRRNDKVWTAGDRALRTTSPLYSSTP